MLLEACEYTADFIRFGAAIFQNLIGGERLAALAVAFDATGGNGMLATDADALDDAPARRFKGVVNVLGACFSLVHAGNGFLS